MEDDIQEEEDVDIISTDNNGHNSKTLSSTHTSNSSNYLQHTAAYWSKMSINCKCRKCKATDVPLYVTDVGTKYCNSCLLARREGGIKDNDPDTESDTASPATGRRASRILPIRKGSGNKPRPGLEDVSPAQDLSGPESEEEWMSEVVEEDSDDDYESEQEYYATEFVVEAIVDRRIRKVQHHIHANIHNYPLFHSFLPSRSISLFVFFLVFSFLTHSISFFFLKTGQA